MIASGHDAGMGRPPDIVTTEVLALFARHASATYSERVTIEQHARQAAALAQSQGADDALVLAALLHDIGHFLTDPDTEFGVTQHGICGGDWVAERFVDDVSEPVRLHVSAKRYRCFIDPCYEARLSPASIGTLHLQGGPMSDEEAASFESEPYADAALAVRGWDDGAKVVGLEIPPVEYWRPLLEDPALRRGPDPVVGG